MSVIAALTMPSLGAPSLEVETGADGVVTVHAGGRWVAAEGRRLVELGADTLQSLAVRAAGSGAAGSSTANTCRLDISGVTALDTVGAYLLTRAREAAAERGVALTLEGARAEHEGLLNAVATAGCPEVPPPERGHPIKAFVAEIGEAVIRVGVVGRELVGFLGMVTIAFWRAVANPRRMRWTALMAHIEHTGVAALPILGLLSFLIGVVLAYQSADQMRRFGAELLVVNLLGISILREIGILMTAIIVAGRSGSAFTAQIGTMKVNQEVDAIETLGLDVTELLVLPRVLALVISLPLLGFYASVMGLLGGALMCQVLLDISLGQFLRQLHGAVDARTLLVGLVKAPAFAMVIAIVGCYEGLKVSGSAESVGRLTTKAVVESIFLVIVLDAAFSILFATIGV